MEKFKIAVSAKMFGKISKVYVWDLPMKRKYKRFMPKQAFALGEGEILLVEGPEKIIFRKRWSRKTVERKIRLRRLFLDDEGWAQTIRLNLY